MFMVMKMNTDNNEEWISYIDDDDDVRDVNNNNNGSVVLLLLFLLMVVVVSLSLYIDMLLENDVVVVDDSHTHYLTSF